MRTDYPGMEFGEQGSAAPTTGTRYCRARRRRGDVSSLGFSVRHTANGLLFVRAKSAPGRPARSWRGGLAFGAVTGVALVAVTLLLTGAQLPSASHAEACPVRKSTAASVRGQQLLLRAEPVRSGTALLHLCGEKTIRSWTVAVGRGEPVAAQVVGPGTALAAVPMVAGRPAEITVVARPMTGPPLTFAARISPPLLQTDGNY